MAIEDELFDFFKTFTLLLETDFDRRIDAIRRVAEMILDDHYIPLLTPDKLGYSVNFDAKFQDLIRHADKILEELGFAVNLPKSYKLAIVTGLSLIEALRHLYNGNVPNPEKKIYLDKSHRFFIYMIDLLNLYRFILITKSGGEGTDPVKTFSKIYRHKSRYQSSAGNNKTDSEQNENEINLVNTPDAIKNTSKYKIFNLIYLPLVLAYAYNGAGIIRYQNHSKRQHLGYSATALADRLLYLTFHTDLRIAAKELVEIFSAVHKAVLNLPHSLETVSDELTSSILREVTISAIVSRELSYEDKDNEGEKKINDEEIKKIIEKIKKFYENITKTETKSLTLFDLLEIRPAQDVLECRNDEGKLKELISKELLLLTDYTIDEIVKALEAGNLLFVGPPGTGKTRLARELVNALAGSEKCYEVYTANSLWFRNNVIGGESLEHGTTIWRSGLLIRAYANAAKVREGYYYVIIDEVNRADVDKAFGEFFTIISDNDPSSWSIPRSLIEEIDSFEGKRDRFADEFIYYYKRLGNNPLRRIRFIATMNLTDVRNTFYVGDAFARRFTLVFFDTPKGFEDIEFIVKKNNLAIPNLKEVEDLVSRIRERLRYYDFVVSPASVERALILYSRLNDKTLANFVKLLKASLGTLSKDVLREYDKIAKEYLKEKGEVNA